MLTAIMSGQAPDGTVIRVTETENENLQFLAVQLGEEAILQARSLSVAELTESLLSP